jgi:hypothetical protein
MSQRLRKKPGKPKLMGFWELNQKQKQGTKNQSALFRSRSRIENREPSQAHTKLVVTTIRAKATNKMDSTSASDSTTPSWGGKIDATIGIGGSSSDGMARSKSSVDFGNIHCTLDYEDGRSLASKFSRKAARSRYVLKGQSSSFSNAMGRLRWG